MKYRSEIDGLRAVAVIPVILFHAGFELFSGGFVGVDIFFVISGYLITTIIHDEIKNKSFSIVRFYERRARRILPALFFVSLTCIPFAWLWLMPSEYKDFSQSLVAVYLFSSNILFWQESGYFSAAAELKPMLHTWSLAVEEQFYVFFPLFLLIFKKYRDTTLLALLVAISLISLGVSEYSAINHPSANFYLLPTRAWELGIGALLAIGAPYWNSTKIYVAQILSLIGIGLVSYSIFFFNQSVVIPGKFGLFPVVGTALIIAYARHTTLVGKALAWQPMVGIGLVSYSAYLWHQPLFAFARIRMIGELTPEVLLILSFCSFFFAYLTWLFVEKPFRNKNKFSRTQIFSGAAAISILFISFGVLGHYKSGLPQRMSNAALTYYEFSNDIPTRRTDCMSTPKKYLSPPQKDCIYNSDHELNTILWGDSHAAAIADALSLSFLDKKRGLIQLTHIACPPAIGLKSSDADDQCSQFNKESLEYIKNSNIKTVILLARWTLYIEGKRFNNMEGGVEPGEDIYGLPVSENNKFIPNQKRIPEVGGLFRSAIETLLREGKRVVLVYPVPEVGWNVPESLARISQFGLSLKEDLSTSFNVFENRSMNAYMQLDLLNSHPNLIRVYPHEVFCNNTLEGRCVTKLNDKPLYYDDDHLNSIGSYMLANEILIKMNEKHWTE